MNIDPNIKLASILWTIGLSIWRKAFKEGKESFVVQSMSRLDLKSVPNVLTLNRRDILRLRKCKEKKRKKKDQ